MAFIIFDRKQLDGNAVLCPTNEPFKLAGYNLLHAAWTKYGSPIEVGWQVSADDLIKLHYDGAHHSNSKRFVIDFDIQTRHVELD